ncbi:MAG: lipopolysaccharide assembly protein LapA domain-containing protein [Microcoleaceae cyanobacterium]
MKLMQTILINFLVVFWIGAIALIAIQNATPFTLQFFGWETISMPLGIMIALSVMLGIITGTIMLPFLQSKGTAKKSSTSW